jgi:predicted ferric reductase
LPRADAVTVGAGRQRQDLGWLLAAALSLGPIVFWLTAIPLRVRFENLAATLHSLANIAALVGTAGFAVNLILGARLGVVERMFGGLDRLYRAHRFVGYGSLILILLHALLLALSKAVQSGGASAVELFLPGAGLAIFTGVIALFGMAVAMVLTLLARLEHEVFVYVQRSFGLMFLIASFHVFRVEGTKAYSHALTVYMAALSVLAISAFAYRSVLGRYLVRTRDYRVRRVNRLDDSVAEIVLAPRANAIPFESGQFAFVSVIHGSVSTEPHPFSIASSPHDPDVRIVVKALGDYTTDLVKHLEPPASARVEGPYGRFSYLRTANPDQVWIAGGIGVTPFLSMARSLDVTGHQVDFYYCTEGSDQAYFLDEFFEISDHHPNFRVIPIRKVSLGHLTVEDIRGVSSELPAKDFFICGPPVMIKSLKTQLLGLGVPIGQIHYEDFDFM